MKGNGEQEGEQGCGGNRRLVQQLKGQWQHSHPQLQESWLSKFEVPDEFESSQRQATKVGYVRFGDCYCDAYDECNLVRQ